MTVQRNPCHDEFCGSEEEVPNSDSKQGCAKSEK